MKNLLMLALLVITGVAQGQTNFEKGQFADGVDLEHPIFDGVFTGKSTNML